jgi:hypothetical protein
MSVKKMFVVLSRLSTLVGNLRLSRKNNVKMGGGWQSM